ncbi:hypothetical protein HBI25_171870 [Parastagonospora nodorum]|nr:hypothetical protein HBH50_091120 [Parastagonospora nodorum]KAH4081344.1 hypothetical protein HBH46_226480 [Parastagonospora nodorum]KAH4092800.1 hypothetical protein HBH48_072270 [Parastagonospora nodorum]KAH4206865.1 hypothetical protein HBI95_121710 [Parastagonospora nodorum]KAH4413720.1 hypothetical protein HBH92_097080 [Parastagonospora nodorum]
MVLVKRLADQRHVPEPNSLDDTDSRLLQLPTEIQTMIFNEVLHIGTIYIDLTRSSDQKTMRFAYIPSNSTALRKVI